MSGSKRTWQAKRKVWRVRANQEEMQYNVLLHDLAVPSLANRERILNSKTKDKQAVNHSHLSRTDSWCCREEHDRCLRSLAKIGVYYFHIRTVPLSWWITKASINVRHKHRHFHKNGSFSRIESWRIGLSSSYNERHKRSAKIWNGEWKTGYRS